MIFSWNGAKQYIGDHYYERKVGIFLESLCKN